MKTIKILIIISFFFSCNQDENPIEISSYRSNEKVTLFYSAKMETISVISIPINLKIENNSNENQIFRNYNYKYGNKQKGNSVNIFLNNDNKLIRQGFTDMKVIESHDNNSYLIRTKHFVDTTKFKSNFFKPYIEKMLRLNQDTLNIGTIAELEIQHKDLIENLIQNDSISLLFLDEESETGFRKELFSANF